MITRVLLGCFCALCLGFVVGCGGSTETSVIDTSDLSETEMQQADDDYEAQMAADEASASE